MNKADWLHRLRRGEEDAYRIFFEDYYQILGVFAMKYVKNKEIADDIANDVILELYSRKLKFDNIVALKSYLFLSIKHRSLNHLRNTKAQKRYLQTTITESDDVFFLDNIIEEEVYFLLRTAIKTLSEMPRKIFLLSLQGMTNEQIAQELSLSIDSVKAHKKRGKQILTDKLKGLMSLLSVTI